MTELDAHLQEIAEQLAQWAIKAESAIKRLLAYLKATWERPR